MARFSAVLSALVAAVILPGTALAQGGHGGGGTLPTPELLAGFTHAVVQGTAVFLAGLAALAVLVWLPAGRSSSLEGDLGGVFARGAWVLFWILVVAVIVDVCVYTVRASGELSFEFLVEGFFGTGVGRESLARVGTGLLAALATAWAARGEVLARWWAAAGAGGVLLATLVTESHAVAQGFVPMLAIWLHLVAAALWMGGLLAFPLLLLGPMRALELDERADLRRRVVRRFSRVATVAVAVILLTGAYSTLQNVSGFVALTGTAYGRALIMKLGLTVLLLATGGINLMDKGKGPLGRMVGLELALAAGIFVAAGFLTSLPPAN